MMRQCHEEERARILEYISKEPEMNLFFYGDIENFGVESEEVSILVHEREGVWNSLLLKYFDYYLVYSQAEDYEVEPIVAYLKGKTVDCISGKTSLVQRLAPYYPMYTVTSTYLSRCNHVQKQNRNIGQASIRKLDKADVENMIDFYLLIEEFAKTYQGKRDKMIKQELVNMEHGMAYGVFLENELVAVAETSADNTISAMVVGVATHPEYRGRGYAMAVVTKLCEESFQNGKSFLCLFYNNPSAGRLYKKVGFEEVGEYAMLR